MSLREEIVHMVQQVVEAGQSIVGIKSSRYAAYIKGIFCIVLAIILGSIGFFSYRWYTISCEKSAQKVLSQYLREYNAIKDNDAQSLAYVSTLFEKGYQNYKKCSIAPYFLAFKADVQIKQGNKSDAITTLDTMLTTLSAQSPLFNLFKTKRALLKVDSVDEGIRQVGLNELAQLAKDTNNQFSDIALFYQGYYYWITDALPQAREVWQQLVEKNRANQHAPSPWVAQVEQKLEQIPV